MSKLRRSAKTVGATHNRFGVFFTACEVPDISNFTEQSSEMTRGIRKGVKDTDSLLKTASERNDLYSAETIVRIRADLKDYTNARETNRVVLEFNDSIKKNDGIVQNELERILTFQALVPQINQFVINGDDANALRTKITLKNVLDALSGKSQHDLQPA